MQQATITLDLELIFTILSIATIAISSWTIIYFTAKIVLNIYIHHNLGDAPSAEEISEHYKQINNSVLWIQSETSEAEKQL